MSLGNLIKAGKALYNTVDEAVSKTAKAVDTAVQKKKQQADSMTFDLGQVKSTVTNPSTKFKGISVEDEQKIMRITNQMYPNGSQFEKDQAIQWLYASALKAQKQKDIDIWRQNLKLELQNLAENAKSTRDKNNYNVQVKKANLADLIKEQLSLDWYNVSKIMNLTDDWVISGFLQTNPEYQDAFNKFFYNDQDALTLGKELWWIEKDWYDKTWDIIKGIWKWIVWWIPKFWEWVEDLLGLTDKDVSGFYNYVYDKYGTAPANLTLKDYTQAKAEYEWTDKKQYQPSVTSAWTKISEWLADIFFTTMWWPKALKATWDILRTWKTTEKGIKAINWLYKTMATNTAFKWALWGMSETPYLNKVPEVMWEWLSRAWAYINKVPILKDIRDSLPEKDKAEWDAFVAGNVLWLSKKTAWKVWGGIKEWAKIYKNLDEVWKANAIEQAKKWNLQAAWDAVKDNVESNILNKLEEQKLKQAHKASQSAYEQRWAAANALDDLNEWGSLKNVKSLDDLLWLADEKIDILKREQEDIAKNKTYKNLSSKDLSIDTPTEVYSQKLWKKVMRAETEQPFIDLLDNIIEHYEKVDNAKARTYKSYKAALESEWWLPAEIALEIKRHGNYLHQRDYNSKTWLLKDADKSKKWDANIEKINKVVEWLDIWEDLRARDAKLSSYYTLKSSLERLKGSAAELEKKMADSGWSKTIGKTINKSAFWTWWMWLKAVVSWLQSIVETLWLTNKVYDPVQLSDKIPRFVEDYVKLIDKMKNEPKESTSLLNKFYKDWKYLAEPYSDEEDK